MFDAQSRRITAVSPEEEERRLVPPPSPPPPPPLPVGTGYHRRRTMLTIQSSGQYVGQPGNNSSTLSSSSSTPCAACKLLRRRCAQECPFSPYFSPHEPQKFACVHKIYGASNVSKMLMDVPENHRADAASSLVYEASARLRDPVYGCLGAISALQQQLEALQAELNAVKDACSMQQQVLMRKSMEHNGARMPSETTISTVPMAYRPHGDTSNLTAIFPHGVGHGERQSPDYAVPSPNGAGTPDVKERYWSSIS